MVEFFTAILVGALLHLLFGPFFDDALESLGEWRMGRAVARRERRQRRSTNDSVKPAARPGRRACSSYALTRVGSEGEGSNSFRTSPTSTRLPASGFHTKMDFRPLPRKVKASYRPASTHTHRLAWSSGLPCVCVCGLSSRDRKARLREREPGAYSRRKKAARRRSSVKEPESA
jgi:hypothetical protein